MGSFYNLFGNMQTTIFDRNGAFTEKVVHGLMSAMKPIAEIRRLNFLTLIREKCGDSQTACAEALGYSTPSLVNRYASGAKDIGKNGARKMEQVFGYPEFWMDTDHEAPGRLPADMGNVETWETREDLLGEDRVWIDRYDYHFSAGTGLIQWEVREKQAIPFNLAFFKAKGANPKDCKLLVVRGDSMEPWVEDRNVIMVDTSETRVKDGERYAIYFEDEPLVKQIFKEAGGALRLHSYNSKYPDKIINEEKLEFVKVVGKVIYRSG
ncbi:S24 family peptidase [Burkholderia gladioli]|uniref:S24 family peptidase n=1 Tax=Burkholderia gladioli TaxID=28095 RepID=UPI001FC86CB8|nr:S24 family peptidase [Burkholderia gladioli]